MTQTVLLVGDVFFFDFGFVVFIVIRMSRRHLSSSSRYRGCLRLSCSLGLAIQHASIACFLCQDVIGDMLEALRCRPTGSVGRGLFGLSR